MNKKVVLIDGHSILTRAFFGIPDLTTSKGVHTNAVLGFLNIMLKIIEEEKPDNLMVAFDLKEPTFRHELFSEYKGTRKPMPNELHEQVPIIKEVLEAMNIKVVTLKGYEADDILGTLSVKGINNGYDVTIVSGDRDLLQLAKENVLIRIPKTKPSGTEIENYYEKDVLEKYQVTPTEFIDLKALMGDASDNIPGVKSIGEKTATKLITEYKTIEAIYEKIDEIKPERVKNALINDKENAFLSKVLARIDIAVPIDFDIEDGKLYDIFNEKSYVLVKQLEFKSLLKRFSEMEEEKEADSSFEDYTKAKTINDILKRIQEVKPVYTGVSYEYLKELNLGCLFISFNDENYYIESGENISDSDLRNLLKEIQKISVISLFDLKKYLPEIEFSEEKLIIDQMIGAYLINPLKDTYHYEDIARDYLSKTLKTRVEIAGKSTLLSLYSEKYEEFIKLMLYEAVTGKQAAPILIDALKKEQMYELYTDMEYPLIYVLYEMEKNGIRVNASELKEYGDELEKDIIRIQKEIYEDTGVEFNINSPKQLGEVLFEKMGIPGGKKTKTGYSTGADVLQKISKDYKVVDKILLYRTLTKLKSTYADGLANYIDYDGRIHGKFNQTIAATGRISSTEPNLQNIPIKMEIGRRIRKVFIPEDGKVFIDADYSQIELRILAHMSGDKNLIEAYNSNQDIHRITASKVFHVPFEEVTKEMRNNAKAVNFGIVYGISSFGLSQDLSISKKEAAEYIDEYFKTYPSIKEFLDNTVINAKEDGFVATIFNRKRPIPELSSSNFMQRSFGERAAMNSAIQGTAADIMKIAMINIYKGLKEKNLKSRIVLQIHDEVLIEAEKDEIEIVKEIVTKSMMDAAKLKVVLQIEISEGTDWLMAH